MAAVRVVVNYKVKPGREKDLFEGLRTVKGIVTTLGATAVTVSRQAFGAEAGNIFLVAQFPNWATFAKVSSDQEFQHLLEQLRANPNPPIEAVVTSLNEEVSI
jgi:hypothetical protein